MGNSSPERVEDVTRVTSSKKWQNGDLEPLKGQTDSQLHTPNEKERNNSKKRGSKALWLWILKLNQKEWWIIGLGILGAAIQGSLFPIFAIFFAEVLRVYTLPSEMVLEEVHQWAGLSLLVGGISGIATFFKVSSTCVLAL